MPVISLQLSFGHFILLAMFISRTDKPRTDKIRSGLQDRSPTSGPLFI